MGPANHVVTFVGMRRALREPIVHAAAHVGGVGGGGAGEWGGGDVITFVGMRRALHEPIVPAAAHVGVGKAGDVNMFVAVSQCIWTIFCF